MVQGSNIVRSGAETPKSSGETGWVLSEGGDRREG